MASSFLNATSGSLAMLICFLYILSASLTTYSAFLLITMRCLRSALTTAWRKFATASSGLTSPDMDGETASVEMKKFKNYKLATT